MLLRKELEVMAATFQTTASTAVSTASATSTTTTQSSTSTVTSSAKAPVVSASIAVENDKSALKLSKLPKAALKSPTKSPDEVTLRRDENREKLFMRPGVIDEEPDSVDSLISDPSSFPITIVPSSTGGGGLLIRNSTLNSSFGRLSRISTNTTKYVHEQHKKMTKTNKQIFEYKYFHAKASVNSNRVIKIINICINYN